MEKIKKQIRLEKGKDVNIQLKLTQSFYDIGFQSVSDTDIGGAITLRKTKVTGTTLSRLNELKKYGDHTALDKKYTVSVDGSNGVVLASSGPNVITYILDDIEFTDNLEDGITRFIYYTPTNPDDLENKVIYKDDRYLNYTSMKVKNDLDIVRQSLSVLESHYRLVDIRLLEELELYGGGYYNIIKNT